MAIKTFSEEEILQLQQNPYVKRVSRTTITYTQEFREYYISEYQRGVSPHVILSQAGLERSVLGKERCDSISRNFRRMAKREDGLEDMRKTGRPLKRELSPEEQIKRLKQKVKYLEQENEFLKKISFSDKKALNAHAQKKNFKSSMKCSSETTMS